MPAWVYVVQRIVLYIDVAVLRKRSGSLAQIAVLLNEPAHFGVVVPGAQVLQAGGDVGGFAVVQEQVGIEAVGVHLAAEQVPPLLVQVRAHAVSEAKNV